MDRRWLVALAVVSCGGDPEPAGPSTTSFVIRREIPLFGQPKLDLLFVVDNSPAMAPHRETLRANAAGFATALENLQFGMPDLQLGVITTDLGTRGADDNSSTEIGDCTANGDAGILRGKFFIDRRHLDGTHEVNYDGALGDALAATFDAIPVGCSFPRPLEAVRRAIRNPANAGFVRDDAALLVVLLTPNDDCSFRHATFLDGADAFSCVETSDLVPVDQLADALKSIKDDPSRVMVAGGFGPDEPFAPDAQQRVVAPSCTIDQRSAQPGVRLAAFLDQFPNRSSFTSLCNDDLGEVLQLIQQTIHVTLASPCFESTIPDVDLDAPGDQFDCAAWLRTVDDERVLPPCDDGDAMCWRIATDPINCPQASMQSLVLDHYLPAVESATLVVECVAE